MESGFFAPLKTHLTIGFSLLKYIGTAVITLYVY